MLLSYFLTNEVSWLFLKTLLEDSIIAVEKSCVHMKVVVCDRQGEPVAMAKLVGFQVHETSYQNLKTNFKQRHDPQRMCI